MKLDGLINKCNLFYKVARKQDNLEILKSNIGNYIHFSNSDRFGISYHHNIHPGNPRGVYGFPLTPELFNLITKNNAHMEDYGYSKYIYIFNTTGNVLNLDNFDLKEVAKKIRDFFVSQYGDKVSDLTIKMLDLHIRQIGTGIIGGVKPLHDIISSVINSLTLSNVMVNEHSAFNVIIRGAGFDAMETRKGGFLDNIREEIVILNPATINLITKIDNPMLSKKDVDKINWENSDEYKEQRERARRAKEFEEEERLDAINRLNNERAKLNQMEQDLREERKRSGSSPEYLAKLDLHLELTKKLNEKWKHLF